MTDEIEHPMPFLGEVEDAAKLCVEELAAPVDHGNGTRDPRRIDAALLRRERATGRARLVDGKRSRRVNAAAGSAAVA